MGSLATIDDYYAFKGLAVPTMDAAAELKMNADLERATDGVRPALRLMSVPVADDGLPAAGKHRTAVVRAVCAQYDAVLAATGDDGDFSGAAPIYDNVSAIGVQFSRRSGGSGTAAWSPLNGVAPEAIQILQGAGVFSTYVGRV